MATLIQEKCFNCKKLGIVQCDGCIHRFCSVHFSEHRHKLDELFKEICDKQKCLFDKINDPYNLSTSIYPKKESLMKEINLWEQKTLNIVKKTADLARQKLNELIIPDNRIVEDELDNLSEELKRRKEDGDYFEQDIQQLNKKLKQIETDIKVDPPQIRIRTKFIDWSKVLDIVNETSKYNIISDQQQFFSGGTLLTLDHQIQLNQFYGNENQKWRMIYKATRDGFDSKDFHRCCDEKGPTLTLIQSTDEYLFGGYTKIDWNKKTKGWMMDKTAFIFTLINPHNIIPTKYLINNNGKDAIYPGGNGPAFGSIDININSNSNTNNKNYFMFPRSYCDTTGEGHLTFTNTETFSTLDIEIYRSIST
jgi:hypothetical protein